MEIVTLIASVITLVLTGINIFVTYKKYKYESYAQLMEKRMEKLEKSTIEYASLISRYNHVRFTLWEQQFNMDLHTFTNSNLNELSYKMEQQKQTILFLLDESEEAQNSIKAILKIGKFES